MTVDAPEAHVPEIVGRYVSTALDDFVTRRQQVDELGDVLEQILREVESDSIRDRSGSFFAKLWEGPASIDGVVVETVETQIHPLNAKAGCGCSVKPDSHSRFQSMLASASRAIVTQSPVTM
jgi:hypothetical protein